MKDEEKKCENNQILLNFNDVVRGLNDAAERWNKRTGGQNE